LLVAIKRGLWVTVTVASLAIAQPAAAPQFEVASIKPSAEPPGSSGITTKKGRLTAQNVTLKRCIRGAYGVPEIQILGGPPWIGDDRYFIEATAAGPVGDPELSVMLQALLAERFKLALHRETRALPGYALLVGKGLKAKRSDPDSESRTNYSQKSIQAERCTMAQLAQKLSDALHTPVADLTAISGAFDFTLEWTPDDMKAALGGNAPFGPSIFAALQEQLGLRLESRKVPTGVVVIDHAERPSEN